MKYELLYNEEEDIIFGRVEGDLDKTQLKLMASEFADLVRSTGCTKLLNDLRNANIGLSILDIWDVPRIISKTGVPLTCKRALLIDKPSEEAEFLETVSVNFFQQVRIFIDVSSALNWLKTK